MGQREKEREHYIIKGSEVKLCMQCVQIWAIILQLIEVKQALIWLAGKARLGGTRAFV